MSRPPTPQVNWSFQFTLEKHDQTLQFAELEWKCFGHHIVPLGTWNGRTTWQHLAPGMAWNGGALQLKFEVPWFICV